MEGLRSGGWAMMPRGHFRDEGSQDYRKSEHERYFFVLGVFDLAWRLGHWFWLGVVGFARGYPHPLVPVTHNEDSSHLRSTPHNRVARMRNSCIFKPRCSAILILSCKYICSIILSFSIIQSATKAAWRSGSAPGS